MRLLELSLVLLTVILSFWLFYFHRKERKVLLYAALANTIILILHVIIERIRWQMFFVYLFAIYLIIFTIARYLKGMKLRINRGLGIFLKFISTIILIASIILIYVLPVPTLPKPTGESLISTMRLQLVDESRLEAYTQEEGDHRQLMITIWYPSQEDKMAKSKPYITDFDLFSKTIANAAGIPEFLFSHFKHIKTHTTMEAPISSQYEKYPLLIFSHGLGTTPLIYTTMLEELVSNGYIIVTIDHTYSTMATTFIDNKATGFDIDIETFSEEELKQLEDTWVQDVKFVLTEIEALNAGDSIFAQRIDLSKVGVFGHSFGGATAYQACYQDDRIKAAVNLDGSIYNIASGLSQKGKHIMMLTSEEYAKAILVNQEVAKDLDTYRFFRDIMKEEGIFLSINGTKHYNFSDVPLMSPLAKMTGMVGEIDGSHCLKVVNTYLLAFFDHYLKGSQTELLQGSVQEYPEVDFKVLQ